MTLSSWFHHEVNFWHQKRETSSLGFKEDLAERVPSMIDFPLIYTVDGQSDCFSCLDTDFAVPYSSSSETAVQRLSRTLERLNVTVYTWLNSQFLSDSSLRVWFSFCQP